MNKILAFKIVTVVYFWVMCVIIPITITDDRFTLIQHLTDYVGMFFVLQFIAYISLILTEYIIEEIDY